MTNEIQEEVVTSTGVKEFPNVIDLFGRPNVQENTNQDLDTRSKLLDKTLNDSDLDAKIDLSVTSDNKFLYLFSRADAHAELIKERYGSVVLTDFFYKYKKQSLSKGRQSRIEMVDIISGRNFPDFDEVQNEFQSSSMLEKLRGVIRR